MTEPIILHCRGVNFYLIGCEGGKLLVDSGWPSCLADIRQQLRSHALKFIDIRFVMTTHAHPDHAGLLQTLKRKCSARLIVHKIQIPALAALNSFFIQKRDPQYEPFQVDPSDIVIGTGNRQVFQTIGIRGEAIETPGHSNDSISLALDGGCVFTGDLTRPDMAGDENAWIIRTSWERLLRLQPTWIYPGHGERISSETLRRFCW